MTDQSAAKQDLASMLEGLLPEQQVLLARRLLKKRKAASPEERTEPAIPVVAERTNLPLSFGQQRLWFIDQLEPDSPLYNLHLALRVEGNLEVPLLEQALVELIDRHEVLRTTFAVVRDQPVQVIGPVPAQPLTVIDLTRQSPQEQQAAVQHYRSAERLRPFDLARGPLLRVALLKINPEGTRKEHVLLITLHHIIADRWSIGILLREWIAIYTARREGRPPALVPLRVQYADFAAWQRLLQAETLERQLGYWKQHLANAPALLDLVTDYARPPVQSFRGNVVTFELDPSLADAIKRLSHQAGSTLFMTLLAAFAVLLSHYSREEDLVIGSPIANRKYKAIEPLIGFFINTLALRINVAQKQTWTELLQHVRQITLDALTHQDVPFEQVVDALNIERSLSYNPLFQVMFDLRNADLEQMDLSDVRVTALEIDSAEAQEDSKIAKFDLTLTMLETAAGLSGDLEYNVDLFRPATIERMIGHFQALLAAIVAQPGQQLRQLSCITEAERQAVLIDWNATRREYAVDQSAHALFAAQAAAQPDAVAVVCEAEHLTYAALDRRATRLAHVLHAQGVGPESRVGVCVERSLDMIVCVLAIWKAGGAYVALDPGYPAERLAFMLADSQPHALLAQQSCLAALPEAEIPLICLEDALAPTEPAPTSPLPERVDGQHLAYVVYTSGSTGLPKGVMVEQRSLVNAFFAWRDAYNLRPGQHHLQMASFSFDVFAGDLVRALCSGGTLVICPREVLIDSGALYRLIQREQISCAEFVPVVMRELLRYLEAAGQLLEGMDCLIVGSDVWWIDEYRRIQAWCSSQTAIISSYGLSEATIDSTFFVERDQFLPANRVVPIGRPFANTRIYILDSAFQPVPPGMVGDLYIGGIGLARGYQQQPDLTAARFIPDPFSQTPGMRLYKTGDLACYLPDGNIEFLGRGDQQVKIRGFRVELGEIESALAQHSAIQDVAVMTWQNKRQETQMVAYIVPAAQTELAAHQLRDFLKERLPAHMVPVAFIALDALPLTPNGKIDRRSLPKPDLHDSMIADAFVAPTTPTEQTLAAIWSEILQHEPIGIHDDFFALGGHSLLATQVISRLRTTWQIELPLRVLFEQPTIAGCAAEIEARLQQQGEHVAPIVRVSRNQPLPLSFSQQRLWFLSQFEPGTAAYNMVNSVRLVGDLNVPALQATLDEIVRRHEVLRTIFTLQDGQAVQIILPPTGASFHRVDLQQIAPDERLDQARQIVYAETQHAFDLADGPLFRATLIQLAPRAHVLCLNVHHIVSDGWSESIFLRELAAIYRAFCDGEPSPLPELTIQYADFACWQQQLLQGAYLEQQIAYWRGQLGDEYAPLQLPLDRPRPLIRTSAGARLPYRVDVPLAAALKALASASGVSLYIVLLAALKALLYRYTHEPQISIGTYIANRNQQVIEPLIGFFINTLVLRTDLSGRPSFRQLVSRVKDVALGAYEHQDLPFEKLIEELQPSRDMSHTPFFQVMLVLQNTPETTMELPGLQIEQFEPPAKAHAQFDLTLWLNEQDDALLGSLEYNTDLFDEATVARMAEHLTNLLACVAANPEQQITTLSFLSDQERARLVDDWNSTAVDYALDQCLHTLVEQWAARTPDAEAVVFAGQSLSYQALDCRANQLAHALQKRGVGPETRVGVYVARSLEMIVAVLAVLKAGGAYVPLDPTYPPDRVALMLRDSDPLVIITHSAVRATLPASNAAVLCLDTDQTELAGYPEQRPESHATARSLAYIVYTSGSTDTPKGVLVERGSLTNAFYGWRDSYGLRPGMRHLQMASFAFDVFAGDLVRALGSGGTLVICPRELLLDPPRLYDLIRQQRVVCGEFVPAVIRELMAFLRETEQRLDGWDLVIVGSDLWTIDEYRQLRAVCGATTRVINSYGLSEATIDSTYFEGSALSLSPDTSVPIGRPFANTQMYILDQHLNAVPIGVIGEIYIGGAGLARGYCNRADLTAERFIPNPFADHSRTRLYKTGDLGRYLPDGNIEFLGRNDHQVKIRGYRIELGEIETALRQHEAVHDALVLVRDDRLVAYVVTEKNQEPRTKNQADERDGSRFSVVGSSDLRAFLQARLPEYMIPAAFVQLPAFPLTPNGKLDRRSLPVPDLWQRHLENDSVPPRDAIELQLVAIWEDLLGIESIGVKDNFFELGGHSLLAVHLMARIHRRFNRQLPLAVLFQSATIEHLAGLLRGDTSAVSWSPLVPMQTRGDQPPLFCVPGAGGNVIGFYGLARRLGVDRPIYGLQARGLDGETPPHTSVEEMAACYVAAIQTVQPEGPYYLCGYSFGSWVAFEIAQQLQRQDQEVALLAILNSPTPMVMSDDPAYRTQPRSAARDEITTILAVARSLERTFGVDLGLTRERLEPLSAAEQITLLTEQLKQASILPAEAETSQVRGFVNVFKTNYDITYIPQEWQPTRIALFRASERLAEDDDVPPILRDDPAWGWNQFASAPVEVHFVPGEHLTILMEPHVESLGEQLGACLKEQPVPRP